MEPGGVNDVMHRKRGLRIWGIWKKAESWVPASERESRDSELGEAKRLCALRAPRVGWIENWRCKSSQHRKIVSLSLSSCRVTFNSNVIKSFVPEPISWISCISDSYGPPHMAVQKQDDQQEHTFSSYVRIQDAVLKTYLGRWTIGRSGERGSGISVLPARYDDDDDDDICLWTFYEHYVHFTYPYHVYFTYSGDSLYNVLTNIFSSYISAHPIWMCWIQIYK